MNVECPKPHPRLPPRDHRLMTAMTFRKGASLSLIIADGRRRPSSPVTFFLARFLLQDVGVLAGRFRHGCCPQSSMIRGVLPPEPAWRPVDR